MTGFGAAEGKAGGGRLRIEIRTVNHRHLSVQLKTPSELSPLETDLRERLRKHFERGHATVSARWVETPEANGNGVEVDVERAKAVVKALRAVGKKLKIKGDVDLSTVARIPDVVRLSQAESTVSGDDVLPILDDAAKACVKMREREGAALVKDLLGRLTLLSGKAAQISKVAPERWDPLESTCRHASLSIL